MPALSIRLLGAFQVTLQGETITAFESDKARALLAYLAVEASQAHRRERLAGLLWPTSTEKAARTNLRHVLSNVRRVIGDKQTNPPFLDITRHTLQFNQQSDAQVDVTQFLSLTSVSQQSNPDHLTKAVALYQGPFLEGFSLADSPDFEEWLLITREQLSRQMLETLQKLLHYYEDESDYQKALLYAWRWLELDPWQENAYQSLMRLLSQTGQRSLALVQYETCCRILLEEFGAPPTPETVSLYQSILSGTLNGQDSAASVKPPSLPTVPSVTPKINRHNLPVQLTSFVGRKNEITELHQRLLEPNCRLLTIVGPGGIGKTRLSLEVAHTFIKPCHEPAPFVDGIYFVSLVPLRQADQLISAIATAIDFHFDEHQKPKSQLLAYLKNKAMLLVLDNFEHMVTWATEMTDLLLAAPQLKILATSRTSLDLHEEWLYPLQGLDIADPVMEQEQPRPLQTGSAVQLFEQRAKQVNPAFNLTTEVTDVIRICQQVDGVPLAIELAATWTRSLSCETIIDEIEATLSFLSTTRRNVPSRHQSLQAVFEHSWQLLSNLEQQALARLSVFPSDFAQTAAKSIAESPLTILNSLVEQSLLQAFPTGRYQLHPLFREFAAEKLAANAPEQDDAFAQHCNYFLDWLGPLKVKLQSSTFAATVQQINTDYDDASLAIIRAAEVGAWEKVDAALDTLLFYLMEQGHYQEGERLCRLVEEQIQPTPSIPERLVTVTATTWQGYFQHRLGQMAQAKANLEASLAQLADPALPGVDTRAKEALTKRFFGDFEFDSNRERARSLTKQSLQLFQAVGDVWGESETLHTLGWMIKFAGQADEAQAAFECCLTLKRKLGDEAGLAEILSSLAQHLVAISPHEMEKAEQYVQESLRLRQANNHQPGIASALAGLGEIGMWAGNYGEANHYFQQSITVYQDLGVSDSNLATRVMSLGWIEMHLGNYEAAAMHAELSLEAGERLHSRFVTAFTFFLQGAVSLAYQNWSKAQQLLQQCHHIFQSLEQLDEVAGVRAMQAIANIHSGAFDEAAFNIVESLQLAKKIKAYRPYYYALPATALYLAKSEPLLAIELYAAAQNFPYVANSRWFADVVGRHIEGQATSFPADVMTAAQTRGRAKPQAAIIDEILALLQPA